MPEIDFDGVLDQAQGRLQGYRAAEMFLEFVEGEMESGTTAPHCDVRVLHSPGHCTFCDTVPTWQMFRKTAELKFTDELQANDPLLPGEKRSRASADSWGGNEREKE